MKLEYFDADADNADVIAALKRDGATVIRNQVSDELADAVLAELREPFDKLGRFDESDFNGYKTLRVSAVLRESRRSAELVAHQRVMDVADAILLEHCLNYHGQAYRGHVLCGREIVQLRIRACARWFSSCIP